MTQSTIITRKVAVDNLCFSGGSKGADFLFGECATVVGHKVMHFSFIGHTSPCKKNLFPLREMDLMQADKPLAEANKILQRKYPTQSTYVNDLLRRNFFQIKESNRIYAVSFIDWSKTGLVKGGTGWAVTMGIQRGIKDVYVFDQDIQAWWKLHRYVKDGPRYCHWEQCEDVPPPSGYYTGIGSHDILPVGENAIIELFEECE